MNPRKVALFAIGPLGAAALGIITVPLLAWFFSQEDIGRIGMLQVAVSFGVLLCSLGLDQAYVREYHESLNRPLLFKMTVLPGLLLMLLILTLAMSYQNSLSRALFDIDRFFISLLVAMAILAALITRFLSLILRMQERGLAYSLSQMLPKALLLILIGLYIGLGVKNSFDNLLYAFVFSGIAVCLIFAWNTRKEWTSALSQKMDFNSLAGLVKFGAPLIMGGVAFWGLTAIDKVFLKYLSGFEQLGLYSVAVSFAAAATIFQSVFSTVWAPVVYKWAANGEGLEKIEQVTRLVLLLVIILSCGAGLFSWVLVYLLPDEYHSVRWLLIPCLGFPLFYMLSETTVVGIGITRRTGLSLLPVMGALLVSLLGNWLLIPSFGAAGAAVSTCMAFWLFFILRTELAIYAWRPIRRVALYCYTALIVLGASTAGIYMEKIGAVLQVFWLMVLISTVFIFKGEFSLLANWLKAKRNT